MTIMWTLLTVLALLYIGGYLLLRHQIVLLGQEQDKLKELLWQRRNKLPLLIELLSKHMPLDQVKGNLINLRGTLDTVPSFTELVHGEKDLTSLTNQLLKTKNMPKVKEESVLLGLVKEFSELESKIKTQVTSYHKELEKWQRQHKAVLYRFFPLREKPHAFVRAEIL